MKKIFKILFLSLSVYALILFISAYITLKCELTNINANITTYGNSLWWCINATSVGNSEIYPITFNGRLVGVFIILIGYGLFTINVATISSIITHLLNNELIKRNNKNE